MGIISTLGTIILLTLIAVFVLGQLRMGNDTGTNDLVFESPIREPSPTALMPTPTKTLPTPTPTRWIPTPKPTPIRPEEPTPTALPPEKPADDASGNVWFLTETENEDQKSIRRLVYLPVDAQGVPKSQQPESPFPTQITWPGYGLPSIAPAPRASYLAIIHPPPPGRGIYSTISFVDTLQYRVLPFQPKWPERLILGEFAGWHPDGRHFLFIGGEADDGLWLIDVEGRNPPRQLSEHTSDSAAISPNGQQLIVAGQRPIVVDSEPQLEVGIWLSAIDGTQEQRLFTETPMIRISELSWSPSGQYMIFVTGNQMWLLSLEKKTRLITDRYASGFGYKWSTDNESIVYVAQEEPLSSPPTDLTPGTIEAYRWRFNQLSLRVADINEGKDRRLIPDTHTGDVQPFWSPDNSNIVFLSLRGGSLSIWKIGRDGSGLEKLSSTDTNDTSPIWLQESTDEQVQ